MFGIPIINGDLPWKGPQDMSGRSSHWEVKPGDAVARLVAKAQKILQVPWRVPGREELGPTWYEDDDYWYFLMPLNGVDLFWSIFMGVVMVLWGAIVRLLLLLQVVTATAIRYPMMVSMIQNNNLRGNWVVMRGCWFPRQAQVTLAHEGKLLPLSCGSNVVFCLAAWVHTEKQNTDSNVNVCGNVHS